MNKLDQIISGPSREYRVESSQQRKFRMVRKMTYGKSHDDFMETRPAVILGLVNVGKAEEYSNVFGAGCVTEEDVIRYSTVGRQLPEHKIFSPTEIPNAISLAIKMEYVEFNDGREWRAGNKDAYLRHAGNYAYLRLTGRGRKIYSEIDRNIVVVS